MSWHARFWRFVDRSGDCWLWTGATLTRGYGHFGINRKNHPAHRLSWEIEHGPIPAGLFVCHHCDNPRCVRPDHLFLGTPRQNTQDAIAKGRMAKGEQIAQAKLTEADVRTVRALVSAGITQTEVARRFGVTVSTVNNVHLGKTWRHVA